MDIEHASGLFCYLSYSPVRKRRRLDDLREFILMHNPRRARADKQTSARALHSRDLLSGIS